MADRLVTVATFENTGQAQVAKNALEAEGIRATLGDEMTVDLFWNLSNAIGGVKVQVLEEVAERAVKVLEEKLGSDEDEPIDPQQLAAEAEAATPEVGVEPPESTPSARTSAISRASQPVATESRPDAEAEEKPSERDEYARRFYLAAFFALVLAPLWFYTVYLFMNAAFGEGPLSERSRSRLIIGGVFMGLGGVLPVFFCWSFGVAFR